MAAMAGTYWPWVPFHFGHVCHVCHTCHTWTWQWLSLQSLSLFTLSCPSTTVCSAYSLHGPAKLQTVQHCVGQNGTLWRISQHDTLWYVWSILKLSKVCWWFFLHALTLSVFSAWEILRKPRIFDVQLQCFRPLHLHCGRSPSSRNPSSFFTRSRSRSRSPSTWFALDLHLICHGWHSRLQKPSTSISYDFIIFIIFYLLSYCANAFKVFHSMHTIIVLYYFSEQLGNCCPCSQVCQHRKTFFKHEPVQHCEDLWSTVESIFTIWIYLDCIILYLFGIHCRIASSPPCNTIDSSQSAICCCRSG